jgi:hypothetical protein
MATAPNGLNRTALAADHRGVSTRTRNDLQRIARLLAADIRAHESVTGQEFPPHLLYDAAEALALEHAFHDPRAATAATAEACRVVQSPSAPAPGECGAAILRELAAELGDARHVIARRALRVLA